MAGLARLMGRWLTEGQLRLLMDFLRFGVVGASGFVVDTAVVYGVRGWVGLIWAGLLSYVVAATWTWAVNRAWTFAGRGSGPLWREWVRWMVVNLAGFACNRGLYSLLVVNSEVCRAYPVLALAAGTFAGMFANFFLARRLVFR